MTYILKENHSLAIGLKGERVSCPKNSVRDRRLGHELHVGEGAMVLVIDHSLHSHRETDNGLLVEDHCDASGRGRLLELVAAVRNGHLGWNDKRAQ